MARELTKQEKSFIENELDFMGPGKIPKGVKHEQ
jgi:hypothetical protein